MERIAALVEGHTEYHFMKAAYYNVVAERPFPNGEDVSISLIIECLKDALDTLGRSIKKVIILLDREGRAMSAEDIRSAITTGIGPLPGGRQLYLGVRDRHIENWISSDEPLIQARFGDPSYAYGGDGTYGKAALDSISGKTHRSPTSKAKLLLASSPSQSAIVSPSIAAFKSSIDFTWPWIEG